MARWIGEHRPKDLRIIVSPAVRTQQTAEALKLPLRDFLSTWPGFKSGRLAGSFSLIKTYRCAWSFSDYFLSRYWQ